MAFERPGQMDGHHRAAGDYRALQFRAMALDANGLMAQNTTAGGRIAGVLQNKPNLNEACTVMLSGVTKIVAGAAVAVGAEIASDAAGRAVTAVAGNHVIGEAETAAANAGELISVRLGLGIQPVL